MAKHYSARNIKHFLPVYRAQRRWKDGSRVTIDLPLFPSYIFVRICAQQRPSVLAVPGTLSIVGNRHEPAALLDSEIEALRKGAGTTKIEPHPYLVVGRRARIINGPFSGMEGVLLRKKNGYRVVLTLSVIMESVAVELDACDLVPTNLGCNLSGSSFSTAA
jgi:transcription antitermination factor NusG